MSEDKIQQEIFIWYHNNFCTTKNEPKHIIFSVPNGGYRTKSEAMKLKGTGLVAGVSDLIIVTDKEVVFVEVKNEKGTQSDNQKIFENKIKNLGYRYILVRSLEEFKIKFFN